MLIHWRQSALRERLAFVLLVILTGGSLLFGGGSRADVLSLPLVYGLAALLLGAAALLVRREDLAGLRAPLVLLAALAALMLAQLIPLPPAIWRALPGREAYLPGLDAVGLGREWRPLSLTPDATLYALVALFPVAAALLIAPLSGRLLSGIVPVLLLACGASALVGLLQAAGTLPSFYRISNHGSAVGLFANRNHQATLLVLAFPLLAAWAVSPYADPAQARARAIIAGCAAAAVAPLLLVTGSRGGVVFALVALAGSGALWWRSRPPRGRRRASRAQLGIAAGIAAAALLPAAAVLLFARDKAFGRLAEGVGGEEVRAQNLGLYGQAGWDHFPWGGGFGSFDAMFRRYEPIASLDATYLNHAHNEPAELWIEGGVLPLVLAALFLAWVVRLTIRAWRSSSSRAPEARAGSVVLLVLLGWSLVDYPLRTPTLSVVAAIACALLAFGGEGRRVGKDRPLR